MKLTATCLTPPGNPAGNLRANEGAEQADRAAGLLTAEGRTKGPNSAICSVKSPKSGLRHTFFPFHVKHWAGMREILL